MNRTLSKILPGSILTGVLLLSAGAWSMGPPAGHNPDKMLAYMAQELDLSESQEAQINSIVDESRESGAEDQERLGEIRTAMKAQRTDFDAGRTQKLADELGEITARMAYRMTSTQAQIYQLLEPEQREQMLELAEHREERMQKRWQRMRD